MRTEFKTRNGNKVTNVQKAGDIIVGFVKGRALVWDKNGRRSPKNRSQLDLDLCNKYHIAIRKWGTTYKSTIYDSKPTGKGIIKVIEVEI
jgi:hypothetical protein